MPTHFLERGFRLCPLHVQRPLKHVKQKSKAVPYQPIQNYIFFLKPYCFLIRISPPQFDF